MRDKNNIHFQEKMYVTSVVIANPKNKREILMHTRKDGKWELPGGKLEGEEGYYDAAVRELKEETSLVVPKVKLTVLQAMEWINNGEKVYCLYFMAKRWDGEIKWMEPDKGSEWTWVSTDRIRNGEITSNCVESIKLLKVEVLENVIDLYFCNE